MKIISCLHRYCLCVCALLMLADTANAAVWKPISLEVGTQVFDFSGVNFVDNAYPVGEYILTNNPNAPMLGDSRITITLRDFTSFFGSAPVVVDTLNQTINLSSLFAESFDTDTDCNVFPFTCDVNNPQIVWYGAIGWDFGLVSPVTYVDNMDGTFTANWVVPNSRVSGFNGFGNDSASFTFSAVPIPAPIILFVSGLLGLVGVARRKKA